MSLFSGLFTYRPGEGRTPLEEFTSAALIDILNRLSRGEQIRFLSNFDSVGIKTYKWEDYFADEKPLRWLAEFRVEGAAASGRADLIAFDERGLPRIIIENKIGAEVSDTQLEVYAHSLLNEARNPVALLFLSHTTPIPRDFSRLAKHDYVRLGGSKWRRIGTWLASGISDDAMTRGLGVELRDFLEEQGILQTMMNTDSAAALKLFLSHRDVIENSVTSILEPMQDAFAPWMARRQSNPQVERGVYSYWTNMPSAFVEKAYFAAGIVYPTDCDWWLPTKDQNPQFIMYLAAENEGWPDLKCDGWGWSMEDGELVATLPALEVLADPENCESTLRQWSRTLSQRMAGCIDSASKTQAR